MKWWEFALLIGAGLYLIAQQNPAATSTQPGATATQPIGIARSQLLYGPQIQVPGIPNAVVYLPGNDPFDAGGTTILAPNQNKLPGAGAGTGILAMTSGGSVS